MKKFWLNRKTGELVRKHTRIGAWKYFKADGKHYGYVIKFTDVKLYR